MCFYLHKSLSQADVWDDNQQSNQLLLRWLPQAISEFIPGMAAVAFFKEGSNIETHPRALLCNPRADDVH